MNQFSNIIALLSIFFFPTVYVRGEDGANLWLRYVRIENAQVRKAYEEQFQHFMPLQADGELKEIVEEVNLAIAGMIGKQPKQTEKLLDGTLVCGVYEHSPLLQKLISSADLKNLKNDGFLIRHLVSNKRNVTVVTSNSAAGVMYGAFYLIRCMQVHENLKKVDITSNPLVRLRMVNHWDNPNGSIERGYAGKSIFNWEELPVTNQRLKLYCRSLACHGINGVVINNVNASPKMLTTEYMVKYAGLADLFRKYHIRLFISANFGSPELLGELKTADPLNSEVESWWKSRVNELYRLIPDFGGFLLKADSEGQPGPNKYGRTHSEGANMLAKLLKPRGGLVIWRAFVYGNNLDPDRAKQSYQFFKPLDGEFLDNVILQVKNGPMDFQVGEPVHPLFGALPKTNMMIEFQTTQEYTGQQVHLNYLVPHHSQVLLHDTYGKGKGSEVFKIINGELFNYTHSGITTVINFGDNANWTGHHLAQANIYGYCRLAWDPTLNVDDITTDWIRITFGHDPEVIKTIKSMLDNSYRIYESYTSPLGIGWLTDGKHYSPAPHIRAKNYHMSGPKGLGYDRTSKTGSAYTSQYFEPLRSIYESVQSCPDEHLLFFHHLSYNYILKNGKPVIQHIYDSCYDGVRQVEELISQWNTIESKIDQQRYQEVMERLKVQLSEAVKWRDSLCQYYYSLSGIKDSKGRF